MDRERIIELKIEDDDLVSGVDQISLVDEPAIEYDWIAFRKEKDTFHIPEGEDEKYLNFLSDVGDSEDSLLESGWEVIQSVQFNREDFAVLSSSKPNEKSVLDTEDTLVRFRYGLNPQFQGEGMTIPTSRKFCISMSASNRVYRWEDIDGKDNGMNSSAWTWRGSYNCRHNWFKVTYRKDTRIINKASVNKGKVDETIYGEYVPQPTTQVTLSKEKFTLPLFEDAQDAIDYSKLLGCETGAHPHVYGDKTLWMPCVSHPEEMDIDVSGLPPYVDEVPRCKDKENCKNCVCDKKDKFESYNDYPDAAKENAKIALRYAEENGWGDCGTAVGKQRANQISKGENISEDTISRMASFERHRQHSDKELGDGCGRLMWLAWGGDEGIEWAQRKLKSIRTDMDFPDDTCWNGYEPIGTKRKDGREVPNCVPVKTSKQGFSYQQEGEDQFTVVGPAMIPNKKIIRKDNKGVYEVFFSEETIKQIADKFMKKGYTKDDQHDIHHSGPGEKDVFVSESWIIEDEEYDKSRMYGFTDLPKGTWMVQMKVNNRNIWEKVKSGELRGFSVSGFFEEEEVVDITRETSFLNELTKLLK